MKQAALVIRSRRRSRLRRSLSLSLAKVAKSHWGGVGVALLLLALASRYLGVPVAVAAEPAALAACAERLGPLPAAPGETRHELGARATSRDVVLIELDPELSCAIRTALSPWGMRVLQARGVSPGPSMPGTSVRARRFAQDHSAAAVVWLSQDTEGFALWVYDAENDRALARPAPPPPFDANVAAALALSIKALLRLTTVASAPRSSAAPHAPEVVGPPVVPPAASPESHAPARQRVALYAGARFGLHGLDEPEPRYGVELRWRATSVFVPSMGVASDLWLGIGIEGGTLYAVESAELDGRFWDPSLHAALGLSHPMTEHVALGLSSAVALHLAGLSGTALESGTEVAVQKLNSALSLRPELQVRLARPLHLLLQPGGALWVRRQRYTVNGATLLETPRLSWQLHVGIVLH